MTQVMKGVRVVEVAQHTFVPSAAAILADWGADVIKIEHPTRGDAMRGFVNVAGAAIDPDRNMLIEHANRANAVSASIFRPRPVSRYSMNCARLQMFS